jgi:hypothetical protein
VDSEQWSAFSCQLSAVSLYFVQTLGAPCMTVSAPVKCFFQAFGRKKSIVSRPFGKDGVKGAFFAFISTLDTGLPKPTIGAGRNLRRSS